MKKYHIITLALFMITLLSAGLDAQSLHPDSDSLLNIINSNPPDSTLTTTLRSIIWNNLSYNADFSIEYSDKLLVHGEKIKDPYLKAKSQHYKGIAHRYNGAYENSIKHLTAAITYFRSTKDTANLINPLFHLGVTYSLAGYYKKSIDSYLEQLDISTEKKDTMNMAASHNSIGILFKNIGDDEKALSHYRKAKSYFSLHRNGTADLAMTLANIANVHLLRENLDSALFYNSASIALEKKINRKPGLAFNYDQRSDIFQKIARYDSSFFYLNKSNILYQELNDKMGLALNSISLSWHYNELEKFHEAENSATIALSIMNNMGSWPDRQDALSALIKAKVGLQKYKEAYELQDIWITNLDSVRNESNQQSLDDLNLKYKTAEKDLTISKSKLQLQTRTNQRNQLLSLFLGLSGFAIALFLYQKQKISKDRQLTTQKQELAQQRITQLEKEQKISNMATMIEGQEAERRRIAKDLHDGLGGLLSTVRAKMGQIQSQIEELYDLNIYNSANEMIDQACDEVRRISHNMMPGVLRIEGLQGAIEDIGDQLSNVYKLKVDMNLNFDTSQLTEAQAHMIYRILQEATNNIIRHSQATEVILQAIDYDDHLNILIEDNGIGYDKLNYAPGLGIKSIESRVDFLNGTIDISTGNDGTSISINITTSTL